jgi:hypothetical protein
MTIRRKVITRYPTKRDDSIRHRAWASRSSMSPNASTHPCLLGGRAFRITCDSQQSRNPATWFLPRSTKREALGRRYAASTPALEGNAGFGWKNAAP